MKVQCSQCQEIVEIPDGYAGKHVKCQKCGQSFIASHKYIYEDSSAGFWAFRTMLTTKLIIIIFPVWCIITGLVAIGWIVKMASGPYDVQSKLLKIAIAIFVWLLNVCAFRVVCEGVIVIYRIHDTLEEIRKK
ncbi:MAG TPA: hypothetical protein DDW84_06885 [Phycisphaerales bacterium]|nr:MAG: hypothetical protein A2Y13_03585 [Planctomycetes bacterium GWC2_45_44]HBG78548.1 hypothetical protein [Phycisphaerales bacterium]HBR20896.1 hypothetical protein [Phycisphaerales bacterium]